MSPQFPPQSYIKDWRECGKLLITKAARVAKLADARDLKFNAQRHAR